MLNMLNNSVLILVKGECKIMCKTVGLSHKVVSYCLYRLKCDELQQFIYENHS